ncbi:hypothetical protein K2173_005740 [Erythroxylum novogranatense]|uniref:SWIM-type domain-containing protein n=1 Tax=Erythroxylum novogranatense TaxID=1862640 RepID=A0AAV8U5M9_9ROSI|nr:hypothetical protein K2173_005740 [Erythroxylum novogranatense]
MSASSLVADTVWKSIEATRSAKNRLLYVLSMTYILSVVTEEQLSILHFLFGKNFERATRIVDQKGVKRISGEPSKRSIFQVVGESWRKEEYLCFADSYCAYYSFFYDIVNRGEQLCCKHQLATRLAAALGLCVEIKVSDEQLTLLLVKL